MITRTIAAALMFGLAQCLDITDNGTEPTLLPQLTNTSETALTAQTSKGFMITPINYNWILVTNGDLPTQCNEVQDDEWSSNGNAGNKNMQYYIDYAEQHGYHGFALYTKLNWGEQMYGKIWYKYCPDGPVQVDELTFVEGVQMFLRTDCELLPEVYYLDDVYGRTGVNYDRGGAVINYHKSALTLDARGSFEINSIVTEPNLPISWVDGFGVQQK